MNRSFRLSVMGALLGLAGLTSSSLAAESTAPVRSAIAAI